MVSPESIIPYEYNAFDFCEQEDSSLKSPTENLGQVLFGERIRPSPYQVSFLLQIELTEADMNSFALFVKNFKKKTFQILKKL